MADWGDVPTWINALTTTGALVAAALVVRIELKREERGEEAALSAQAEQVAAWHRYWTPSEARRYGDTLGSIDRWSGWGIELMNDSGLPIYDVQIRVMVFNAADGLWHEVGEWSVAGTLPPGRTRHQPPETTALLVDMDQRRVEVRFRDSAGTSWRRDYDGHLQRK